MDSDFLIREITQIIVSYFQSQSNLNGIDAVEGPDPLLTGRYHLGSLGALEILTLLEHRFNLEFPDEVIDHDLFTSVQSLADAVQALLAPSISPNASDGD